MRSRVAPAGFAVGLALGALVLACQHEEALPAADASSRLSKVSINFNPGVTYAPLMVAKDEGFFEDESIDIEFAALDSASGLAALVSDQLDVLSTGVRASTFNLIQRGEPLRLVAGKGHYNPDCSAEVFLVPDGLAKEIAAAGGSLRGRRIAYMRGGSMEFLVDKLLASQGLTSDDIVSVPLPHGTTFQAMDGVDAVRLAGEPSISFVLRGGGFTVLTTSDDVSRRHQSTMLVFGNRLLNEDRDLGVRFMKAFIRGQRQWEQGPTDRNVEIVARYAKLPTDIIQNMCWVTTPDDGRVDSRDINEFLDWSLNKGYLDTPVTVEWWDPSFIDDAVRSLDAGAK